MATQTTKRGFAFVMAGMGVGLLVTVGIRLVAGFFFSLPYDIGSFVSWEIAGLILGAYFGYVLSHFNYDSLFKHLDNNKK